MKIGLSLPQINGIVLRRDYPDLLDAAGRVIAQHCTISYNGLGDYVTINAVGFIAESRRENLWYNATYNYIQDCTDRISIIYQKNDKEN